MFPGLVNLKLCEPNAQIGETCPDTFLYQHELKNVNKEPTCYKNSKRPSCIDFILTNNRRSFFKINTLFTGSSDFHKLVLSVFKTTFCKSKLKRNNIQKFQEFSRRKLQSGIILLTTVVTVANFLKKFS